MRQGRVRQVAIAATLVLSTAIVWGQGREYSESFAFTRGGTIELKNYKGSIEFLGGRSNQVEVDVRIQPPEDISAEDAEFLLDHASVEMSQDGNRISIVAKFEQPPREERSTNWSNPYFHFKVSAPASAAVKIDDYKSKIEISGFRSEVDLTTYKGVVRLDDLNGPLNLNTYKGAAEIDRFRGSLEVETYKGDVTAVVDELEGDSHFKTYKGKIELVLPRSQGANVRAEVGSRGTIQSDWELHNPDDSESLFEGRIGSGGPAVHFNTKKGSIYLGNARRIRADRGNGEHQTYTGADSENYERKKFRETREYRIAARGGGLAVDGKTNGGISVKGWGENEILIRAKINASGRSDERAKEIASAIEIVTSGTIQARGPEMEDGEGWAVSYEIFTPRRSDLDLQAHNGGIGIEGIHGQLDFTTLNGGIHLSDVGGDVRGRTTNGGLHVTLNGSEWSGHGLDVETMNGGIVIAVPENYSAELESGTVNGAVQLDFPITVEGKVVRKISTTLGRGGRTIRAVTTNGGVIIRRSRQEPL